MPIDSHFDHVGTAAFFQRKYGCRVFLHTADVKTLQAANFVLMAIKIPCRIEMPELTLIETLNFSCDVGGVPLHYYHAPGHTPGSCLIEFGKSYFTGDTIYSHSMGLSRLPGENLETLKQSILKYWNNLRRDSIIYPGHGESASFSQVRRLNRSLLNFLDLVADKEERL